MKSTTTQIYTLSLHDALPISVAEEVRADRVPRLHRLTQLRPHALHDRHEKTLLLTAVWRARPGAAASGSDRKSTRLNSSHVSISYAVFCLKKKKYKAIHYYTP